MTGTLRGCVHPTRSGTATVCRLELLNGGFRADVPNTRPRADGYHFHSWTGSNGALRTSPPQRGNGTGSE
jgi:hypothetical protein